MTTGSNTWPKSPNEQATPTPPVFAYLQSPDSRSSSPPRAPSAACSAAIPKHWPPLAADTIRSRHTELIADPSGDPRSEHIVGLLPDLTTVSAQPMISDVGTAGVLMLAKTKDHQPFTHVDIDMAGLFATRAALALQLATARHDSERLRLPDDRLRIAQDLKDGVVSRLFALGMAMQSTATRTHDRAVSGAIAEHVDELDAIIKDIRSAVFSLGDSDASDADTSPTTVREGP